jgi:hypothetical protein
MLITQQLIDLYTLGATPWRGCFSALPPTVESVCRINHELGIRLPESLLDFAHQCDCYGVWFASIGEDFESPMHILNLNRIFHTEHEDGYTPLPETLVLINHGHDADCDCIDTSIQNVEGEYSIIYWDYEASSSFVPTRLFENFPLYLESLATDMASSYDESRAAKILKGA